jgi:hypothetical protein
MHQISNSVTLRCSVARGTFRLGYPSLGSRQYQLIYHLVTGSGTDVTLQNPTDAEDRMKHVVCRRPLDSGSDDAVHDDETEPNQTGEQRPRRSPKGETQRSQSQ